MMMMMMMMMVMMIIIIITITTVKHQNNPYLLCCNFATKPLEDRQMVTSDCHINHPLVKSIQKDGYV